MPPILSSIPRKPTLQDRSHLKGPISTAISSKHFPLPFSSDRRRHQAMSLKEPARTPKKVGNLFYRF